MERRSKLIRGYLPEYVLNMDELGLFFITLPQKGVVEKRKKSRGGKQIKKQCTITLFVAANDSMVCGPIAVWRFKKLCCFKNLTNISRRHSVRCFANAKACMTTEIMQELLKMLDKKMIAEGRKGGQTFC